MILTALQSNSSGVQVTELRKEIRDMHEDLVRGKQDQPECVSRTFVPALTATILKAKRTRNVFDPHCTGCQ